MHLRSLSPEEIEQLLFDIKKSKEKKIILEFLSNLCGYKLHDASINADQLIEYNNLSNAAAVVIAKGILQARERK